MPRTQCGNCINCQVVSVPVTHSGTAESLSESPGFRTPIINQILARILFLPFYFFPCTVHCSSRSGNTWLVWILNELNICSLIFLEIYGCFVSSETHWQVTKWPCVVGGRAEETRSLLVVVLQNPLGRMQRLLEVKAFLTRSSRCKTWLVCINFWVRCQGRFYRSDWSQPSIIPV